MPCLSCCCVIRAVIAISETRVRALDWQQQLAGRGGIP